MKKNKIILVFLLIYSPFLLAQTTFSTSVKSPYYDGFGYFTQTNNGFLISGQQAMDSTNSYGFSKRNFVLTIDSSGSDTNMKIIDNWGSKADYFTMTKYKSYYYLFGSYLLDTDGVLNNLDTFCFTFCHLDSNFNVIQKIIDTTLAYRQLSMEGFLKQNDSIAFIKGTFSDSNNDPYTLYINFNLSSANISKVYIDTISYYLIDELDQNGRSNHFRIVAGYNKISTIKKHLIIQDNNNLIDSIAIPYLFYSSNLNILKYQNDRLIISGSYYDYGNMQYFYRGLCINEYDTSLNLLNSKFYHHSPDNEVALGYGNSFIRGLNSYFISGYIIKYAMVDTNLGIIVTKTDTNFNQIWQKRVHSETECVLFHTIATKDGGIALIYRKDINNQSDAFFMKIGSNGEITSNKNIGKFRNNNLVLFPNPTNDYISFELNENSDKIISYKVFDINGKEIISSELNKNGKKLNLSEIPKGVYFLEVKTKNSEMLRKSFIKN